jgi:hypothetical protein
MNRVPVTAPPRTRALPFAPRPRQARRRLPSLVDVRLDPAQQRAVDLPAGRALLVLGEAGHGKTTVALHRLARLVERGPRELCAAVVVPTDGLAGLLQPMLRRLGVDLEVLTYDRWASLRARRAFRRLPRESDTTPPSVMRLKRHPALRLALAELSAREPGRIDDDPDAPVRRSARRASRGDLQHLFGDRLLMERVALRGGIPASSVLDTLDRTRIQFSPTAEQEWAHVTDRERLVPVDGPRMDEGTAYGAAGTVDVEDYAVLCELEALRAARDERRPRAALERRYDVLMLDEAQELAPIELAMLGRTLEREGTLIVAGDAQQQTDETTLFPGWMEAMRELGRPTFETVELEIGYRCAPEIVSLARAVLHGPGAGSPPVSQAIHAFDDDRSLAAWLTVGLRGLRRHDRRASVAVICRSPRTARRIADAFRTGDLPARLVYGGDFLPRGLQVTTVDQVKGLEFDFVVVPDADSQSYPDDPRSRHALYVAVTRARHEAVLAHVGERSRLVGFLGNPPSSHNAP